MRLSLLAVTLALPACLDEAPRSGHLAGSATPSPELTTAPTPGSPPSPTPTPTPSPTPTAAREGFVVSEWGTYTSVMGSDGVPLPGLHLEEEGLPPFVHGRCGAGPICLAVGDKDLENLPEPVTQKLETPVLFFYSDTPKVVDVTVDFPSGIISQFFPKAETFAPALGDLGRIAGGSMSWKVQLDPALPHDTFPWVPEDDIWAPSRLVPATPLRVDGEHERFIFYRGLGRFTPPIRVTTDGTVATFHNDSDEAIPAAFHLTRDSSGRGSWRRVEPLSAGASVSFETTREGTLDYLDGARLDLLSALVDSGLTEPEARSMVETWDHSYFQSTGSRVLYIAPRSWTDTLLPIRVEPAPDTLVRTLVGRVEIFSDAEERVLMSRLTAAWQDEAKRYAALSEVSAELGRFAAPHLARLAALARAAGQPDLAGWLTARHEDACVSRF